MPQYFITLLLDPQHSCEPSHFLRESPEFNSVPTARFFCTGISECSIKMNGSISCSYLCSCNQKQMSDQSLDTPRLECGMIISYFCIVFNSVWPSGAIRQQGSGSTLAQVMACCLTAPSHHLDQCGLIISKFLWHSSEGNFYRDVPQPPFTKVSMKITFLKWNWNLPGG